MELDCLRAAICEQLRQIVRIQHLIQEELDELNGLSKPDGNLDVALMESTRSLEITAAVAGISLKDEVVAKFKKMRENLETDAPIAQTMKKRKI